MDRRVVRLTDVQILCAALLSAWMYGCAGADPLTGKAIIHELESQRLPVPDEAGCAPNGAPAGELPTTGPITLADLLAAAEARSPELSAARSAIGVETGRAWQASLYPNPRVDALVEDVSWKDGLSGSKTTVGVTQPFILGRRREAAVGEARAQQRARLAEVDVRRRQLFGEISALHARVLSIRDQQRLSAELRELIGRTVDTAQTRREAGAAPETDVIRPRIEMYRIDGSLGRLNEELKSLVGRLSLLLGGAELDAERLAGTVPMTPHALDLGQLSGRVRASHPALVVADREIEAAAAHLERINAERTPDLDVRVAAGYRSEQDEGIVEVGAGMTLPLWDNREGDRLSARFDLMRSRQRRQAVENELLSRLVEVAGEYEAARSQLEVLRERLVPDAQRVFDQTGEGYRTGHASFLDLLDSQRTLIESRIAQVELAGTAAAARARVMQVAGPLSAGDVPPNGNATEDQGFTQIEERSRQGSTENEP